MSEEKKHELTDTTLLEWVDDVFIYHPADEDQQRRYASVRQAAKTLVTAILIECPSSPDRSAAVRKVREAVMTANASIALKGKA